MILTLEQLKSVTRRMAVDAGRAPCSSVVFESDGDRHDVFATSTDGHRIHVHDIGKRAPVAYHAVVPEWALRAAVIAADPGLHEGVVEVVPPESIASKVTRAGCRLMTEPGWLERDGENSRGVTLRVLFGSAVAAEIRAVPQGRPAPVERVIPADPPAVVASVNISKALRALPGKGEAVQLRQVGATLWLDTSEVGDGHNSREFGDIAGRPAYGPFTVELSRAYLRDALRVAKASGDFDVRLELRPPTRVGRNLPDHPSAVVVRDHSGGRIRAVISPRRVK